MTNSIGAFVAFWKCLHGGEDDCEVAVQNNPDLKEFTERLCSSAERSISSAPDKEIRRNRQDLYATACRTARLASHCNQSEAVDYTVYNSNQYYRFYVPADVAEETVSRCTAMWQSTREIYTDTWSTCNASSRCYITAGEPETIEDMCYGPAYVVMQCEEIYSWCGD
jgi:hypothetical protein